VLTVKSMSSRSSGQAMYSWPSPTAYFPWGTPSNTLRSASEMHCRHRCVSTRTSPDEIVNYSAGEINFHSKDTDIFRRGSWLSMVGVVAEIVIMEIEGALEGGCGLDTGEKNQH
jgi:hypothetical protein